MGVAEMREEGVEREEGEGMTRQKPTAVLIVWPSFSPGWGADRLSASAGQGAWPMPPAAARPLPF